MNTAASIRSASPVTSTLYASFCAYDGYDGRELYAVAVFQDAKRPHGALPRGVIDGTIAHLERIAASPSTAQFPGSVADVCRDDPEAYTGLIDGALRVMAAPGSITGLNALIRELRGMAGLSGLTGYSPHDQHYVMAGELPDGNVDARALSPYTTCMELAKRWLAEIRVRLPGARIATFSASFDDEPPAANDGAVAATCATQTA